VFPFNKPLAPGKGDNQALAVNTTDNTIQYDVAFALVWVEEDTPALNTNESYAFARCTNCAAVSVAFQVVLVKGDNHVAVPQNLSAAVNYNCVNCLTYALATQLFVTLDGPLTSRSMHELEALWQEIAAFGKNIASVPLMANRRRTGPPSGQTTVRRPWARSAERCRLMSAARPPESMKETSVRLTLMRVTPLRSASRPAMTSLGEVTMSSSPLTVSRQLPVGEVARSSAKVWTI